MVVLAGKDGELENRAADRLLRFPRFPRPVKILSFLFKGKLVSFNSSI